MQKETTLFENVSNDNDYKCVISIGMRCFTEIYLKKLGLKQFSTPFDAMYSTSIHQIIDVLKHKFNYNDFIFTENVDLPPFKDPSSIEKSIDNENKIKLLNDKHGFRTCRKIELYENDIDLSYHKAFLPHHNLNNKETREHFDRCFMRIDKIKQKKIKTLFCLFIHPDYAGDPTIHNNDINILKNFLVEQFNGDLLVCSFCNSKMNGQWNIIEHANHFIHIHIETHSEMFEYNGKILNEIFHYLKVDRSKLLSYSDIQNI